MMLRNTTDPLHKTAIVAMEKRFKDGNLLRTYDDPGLSNHDAFSGFNLHAKDFISALTADR